MQHRLRLPCCLPQRAVRVAEPELVEGEDYVMEGLYLVFTAAYLLKRGYCCENGCRNCPWRDETSVMDDNKS